MASQHPIYRSLAAVSLLLTIALTGVSLLLSPSFDGGTQQQLEAIAAGGGAATASALGFTLAQLPMGIGLLAIAHLVARRAPVLAAIGGTLAVLGCFGHAVHGGIANVMLAMAADPAHHAEHAAVIDATFGGAQAPFMLAGLAGTVLGVVVLAIGMLRSRVGSRWVPWTLLAWVLVEFVGSGLVEWSMFASLLLFAAAFVGLATAVLRSDAAEWTSAARLPAATATEERLTAS